MPKKSAFIGCSDQLNDPKRAAFMRAIREDAPSKENLFNRIYSKKASKTACIKGMCLQCCYFDHSAITECTDKRCPLWHVRPFQKKAAK